MQKRSRETALGGAILSHKLYFTASFDKTDGWIIDGGAIHGIPPIEGEETTGLALFPVEAQDLSDLKAAVGEARVIQRLPSRSRIEIQFTSEAPNPQLTFKAVVTALPLPPLGVKIEGDEAAADRVRDELHKMGANGGSSLLVRETDAKSELRLIARGGRYRILRIADDRPLVVDIEGFTPASARLAAERLEHIARWDQTLRLDNPASKLRPEWVRIDIYRVDSTGNLKPLDMAAKGGELMFDYEYRDGEWQEPQFKIKLTNTSHPPESIPVPAAGKTVSLASQVTLLGHPHLKATVGLTTAPLAARSAELPALPPLLRDNPSVVQPFQFSVSRGGEPGLSVLDLLGVANHEAVTREEPLIVRVEASLAANEHVLPVGYDGEFLLPLGRTRRTSGGIEIVLDRLPAPVTDRRTLTGSIRIFFEKVISKTLGVEFRYPLLAVADREGSDIRYTADLDQVRARVATAERILLYIHGIIGDTHGMAASAYGHELKVKPSIAPLAERYDLVLTFDYENINTAIEDNARSLKQRLEAVGLKAGHGKTVHIVAHSMGGLASRWLIEREDGNGVVQHLVLLGTPNAGSPWPTIQDWATAALGIGLNSLSAIAWPAKVLGGLVSAIETIDVALDQMAPGSTFLNSLATSPDPGIPYTILAGNTAILPAAAESEAAKPSRLARLLARLAPQKLLQGVTALAFFGEPNDIAVSVQSITSAPDNRAPQPIIQEVACDHLTYFSSEAGLRALTEGLR